MCLFPFGFGGGGGFDNNIPPPNEKCRNLVSQLKIIMWCQVIIGIIDLFLGFSGVINLFTGFIDLMAACFLCQAYGQISYCPLIVFIFFSMLRFIENFTTIGTLIQNDQPLFTDNSTRNFAVGMILFTIFYYLVVIYLVFQAYKEFKAVSMSGALNYPQQQNHDDENPYQSYPAYGQPAQAGGYNAPAYNAPPQPVSGRSNNFQPFAGSGRAIGGA